MEQQGGQEWQQGEQQQRRQQQRMVVDLAVRAGPPAVAPPPPTPIPNLRLTMMKSSPLLQSQDILAALHHAVDSAGDDLLVTERTRGIPSARTDGQCMPPSPLSRYLAETAFTEKKHTLRALDRAATERATAPAPRPAPTALHASRLAGCTSCSMAEAGSAQLPAGGTSKRGWMGLFACFGR